MTSTHSDTESHSFFRLSRAALIKLLIKAALTAVVLWFVFDKVDFNRLGTIVREQAVVPLFLAMIIYSMQVLLGSLRWQVIMKTLARKKEKTLSLLYAWKVIYIGLFINFYLPGGAVGGDAVRVWLCRSNSISLALAIHSVVIDRIIALIGLALLSYVLLPFLGELLGFDGVSVMVLILMAGLIGLWLVFNIEKYIARFQGKMIVSQLIHFVSNVRRLFSFPASALLAIAFGVSGHVLFCLATSLLADSLGTTLSLADSLMLVPPVVLLTMLPVSIGGWGVREAGMIVMLGLIGIPQEEALMLSIEVGIMAMLVTSPGGFLWLLHRKDKNNLSGEALKQESSI